jgi:hypothetical protein
MFGGLWLITFVIPLLLYLISFNPEQNGSLSEGILAGYFLLLGACAWYGMLWIRRLLNGLSLKIKVTELKRKALKSYGGVILYLFAIGVNLLLTAEFIDFGTFPEFGFEAVIQLILGLAAILLFSGYVLLKSFFPLQNKGILFKILFYIPIVTIIAVVVFIFYLFILLGGPGPH